MKKRKPRKPVEKIVLITHPLFRESMFEGGGHKDKQKLFELSGIISRAAKEPGTHVIVSWDGRHNRPEELKKMLEKVPKSRLHFPDSSKASSRDHTFYNNFFSF